MESFQIIKVRACQMNEELYTKIKKEYLKEALPLRLVFAVVPAVASVFAFMTNDALFMTIGCLLDVIALVFICSVITIIIACSKLSSGEADVVEGTVLRYQLVGWSAYKTVWLHAVIDDEYCSTWANTFHSKGTRVYLVTCKCLFATHKIMVNADKV